MRLPHISPPLRETLHQLDLYLKKHGQGPHAKELAPGLGYENSNVCRHFNLLADAGLITLERRKQRTQKITPLGHRYLEVHAGRPDPDPHVEEPKAPAQAPLFEGPQTVDPVTRTHVNGNWADEFWVNTGAGLEYRKKLGVPQTSEARVFVVMWLGEDPTPEVREKLLELLLVLS